VCSAESAGYRTHTVLLILTMARACDMYRSIAVRLLLCVQVQGVCHPASIRLARAPRCSHRRFGHPTCTQPTQPASIVLSSPMPPLPWPAPPGPTCQHSLSHLRFSYLSSSALPPRACRGGRTDTAGRSLRSSTVSSFAFKEAPGSRRATWAGVGLWASQGRGVAAAPGVFRA